MSSTIIFILLGLAAHICAIPVQNSLALNEETKRVKRGFSGERLAEDDTTAMDKLTDTNEYQITPFADSPTFSEGDIAVSTKSSSVRCFAQSCLWPKSMDGHVHVAYNLSTEYSDIDRMMIEAGMEDVANGTCIRFVPRNHESNYPNIQSKSGCWSYLGVNGGPQDLSLQSPGCMWSGIASHELMHTLGLVHEQSRIDRDKYITILWENVLKDHEFNFDKYKANNLNTPYDYGSLMHFGKYAYSEDGLPTIIPKKYINTAIGQRFGASPIDKMKINKLYKCRE